MKQELIIPPLKKNNDLLFQFRELDFTHIGKHSKLKGDFFFQGIVRISGSIEGTITMLNDATITIDPLGNVKGTIRGHNIEIMGSFDGDIISNGLVHLKSTSFCSGSIHSKTMLIDAGANCNLCAKTLCE